MLLGKHFVTVMTDHPTESDITLRVTPGMFYKPYALTCHLKVVVLVTATLVAVLNLCKLFAKDCVSRGLH